jgi:4'-phosphopantetheinyl transferase EntD
MMPTATPPVTSAGPLARLLRDPRVKIAEMDPRQMPAGMGLFPEESQCVAHAVQSRREQFSAGRWLARLAWAELGQTPVALLNDERRAPIWPAGIVGTITHTQSWCAVAVARQSTVQGIGADVEAATPLDAGLWERVCRPEEREFLLERPAELRGLLAKALFSAKESIYKALFPEVRLFLDFQGMRIELSPTSTPGVWSWWAELQVPWGHLSRGRRLGPGWLSIDKQLIVTGILV